MMKRIFLSFVLLIIVGWINTVMLPIGLLGAGKVAGRQFDNSDASYLIARYGMTFFTNIGVPVILVLLGLSLIWWAPLRSLWRGADMEMDAAMKRANKKRGSAALIVFGLLLLGAQRADAYYDKTDYAEPYFVLPNESAFWVPDVGDNKESQVQFGSLEYFEAKKIPAKRFVIPHVKLENSGLFSNFYVPAGRLIIVDRTPYSREWVKAAHRGTSAKDQSFPCQSTEGINITLEISIGASVTEENAARYLYRFGTAALDGNRTDPNVVFQSVLHGRTLTEVMDTVGRNKVQALMCNEVTVRSFNDANAHAIDMMTSAKAKADEYFKSVGITLDYLGWAGTMEFDADIQAAVNARWTAEHLRPVLDVMKTQAAMDVSRKWSGSLPNVSGWIWFPSDVFDKMSSWFSKGADAAAATTGKK